MNCKVNVVVVLVVVVRRKGNFLKHLCRDANCL